MSLIFCNFAAGFVSNLSKFLLRVQRYDKILRNTNKIVKNVKTYAILAILSLFSMVSLAQVNSYVGVWGELGEWSLLPQESKYGSSMGVAGGLGVMYDLQYKHLIVDIGVGANYGMTAYSVNANQNQTLKNQQDLQGDVFDYVYQVRDRKDQYTNLMVQVPLMVGGQWGRFYCMAGVKAGISLLTNSHTKANLTTYGDYQLFDDFRNMPEYQFFEALPLNKTIRTNFNFNLDVSAEIGARLGYMQSMTGYDIRKSSVQYRLALFFDYGVLDLHKADYLESLTVPAAYDAQAAYGTTTMVDGLTTNDVMSTTDFAKAVNNLMVGVKFTVLFELPKPKNCVICRDANVSLIRARKGGTKFDKD